MSAPSRPAELTRKPLVLVPACHRVLHGHPFLIAGKKYIDAVHLAGCWPVVMPSLTLPDMDTLLEQFDGVLLTGSPSNVHPSHFGEPVLNAALPLDPERDAWTLPLIPKALALGLPLFGICRGLQEVNVALGGSLHQAVQEQPGLADHRSLQAGPVELQYAPAHRVQVSPGGVLHAAVQEPEFWVNSLHGQGIHQLAPGLQVEARAPDGLIEAFSVPGRGFNLCVQWHPEWRAAQEPVSTRLFHAFGQACRAYLKRRCQPEPER